jgi:uncharacterized membrane protein YqhA
MTVAHDQTDEHGEPRPSPVLRTVAGLRFLSIIAVIGSLLGAVLMFVVGSITTIEAIRTYLDGDEGDTSERAVTATVLVVGALDEYLFGLLLFVFAVGIYQLFLASPDDAAQLRRAGLPAWLHVRDLLELKIMLVEVIIVVFIVQFFRLVLDEVEAFEWTLLVVPIAVGIFAVVLWVLRGSVRDDAS